jgi:3-oxoacyl-[acyl-carrier protein] reductase
VSQQSQGSLGGRSALVTGASRGIGRAVALELARHGAAVVVNYREREDAAGLVVAEIAAAGGTAVACRADVSRPEEVARLVGFAAGAHGGLDVLVCSAAVVRSRLAPLLSLEDWRAVLDVDLLGPFLCMKEAIPHMLERRRGSIICISSIVARRGSTGLASYAAAKGGLESLVRTLAVELAKKRIRVNAVAPGLIRTEMTAELRHLAADEVLKHVPLGRFGEPEEVARAVRFLASDEASYITGEILGIDGGLGS